MNRRTTAVGLVATGGVGIAVLAVFAIAQGLARAEPETAMVAVLSDEVAKWAFASAAVSAGLSAAAAGYAVAHVGSAAVGALAEKPELMGRALVLVGWPKASPSTASS